MTKKTKKLSLNKETLTKLSEEALARAAGGSFVCMNFQGRPTNPCPSVNHDARC